MPFLSLRLALRTCMFEIIAVVCDSLGFFACVSLTDIEYYGQCRHMWFPMLRIVDSTIGTHPRFPNIIIGNLVFFARAVIVNKMPTESADGEHASACQGSSLRQWSFACAMSMSVASPVLFSRLQDMIAACAFTGRLCHTSYSLENVWAQSPQTCTTHWIHSMCVLYDNVAVNHSVT